MPRLYSNNGDGIRDIVLTFDDGPNPETTPLLLDILRDRNIQAMFFVVGECLQTEYGKAIVKRAHDEGHTIGNHTHTHQNLRRKNQDEIRIEIKKAHELISSCVGSCEYFRAPYGIYSKQCYEVIRDYNYMDVGWNVDTEDWRRKRNGAWVNYGMNQIKKREDSIVLMHDIHETTVDHIERLIDNITQIDGHRFTLL